MSAEPLVVYLNDHLAGSVAALELIEALADDAKGTPLETTLIRLGGEISEDQATLRDILARVGGEESRIKQATAWMAEKVSRVKFALGAGQYGGLGRLEGLEALALGVHGKLGLWRALGILAADDPRLSAYRFGVLEHRAEQQGELIERERLTAAAAALRTE
jgi:hypothetical protein